MGTYLAEVQRIRTYLASNTMMANLSNPHAVYVGSLKESACRSVARFGVEAAVAVTHHDGGLVKANIP